MAVLAVLVVLGLQAWVIAPYRIPSASMAPTLAVGERILVDRIGLSLSSPRLGDVMVFHPPVDTSSCAAPPGAPGQACDAVGARESSLDFVKRVVGLPGNRLRIVNGRLIDDGHPEPGRGIVACSDNSDCDFPRTIVVPPGDYYMMGDNRPDSQDSRFWGPVPRRWLIGYVSAVYWPLSRIAIL